MGVTRTDVVLGLAALALATLPTIAAAQEAPPEPGPAEAAAASGTATETPGSSGPRASAVDATPNTDDGAVEYAEVDASTVRIFCMGSVEFETLSYQGHNLELAIPHAGHGTGFAVDDRGLIVTARHVVEDAIYTVVRLPGEGGYFAARVVYESESDDVAVLQITVPIKPLRLARSGSRLTVRQTVFAVGYPLDADRPYAQSARGIIAGHLDEGMLQLDMAVNPGNSGGPLVDEDSQVVGMVVARAKKETGAQGIAYAVTLPRLHQAIAIAEERLYTGKVPELTE